MVSKWDDGLYKRESILCIVASDRYGFVFQLGALHKDLLVSAATLWRWEVYLGV